MRSPKVLSVDRLVGFLAMHRDRLDRIVFTNGCFDLLHLGHLATLQWARGQGNVLVVGLNSDASVRRLKGPGRPIVHQAERAELLAALECVDYVTVFNADTPADLIAQVRPHLLVKSRKEAGQPIVGEDLVRSWGGVLAFAPEVAGVSTTGRVEAIARRAA